ncbi:MAG: hypothetical protein JJE17_12185 [Peptostreptococcaceae bacterium]|nr:hypothetical protein [Peptostreptococcaceae bacterium]
MLELPKTVTFLVGENGTGDFYKLIDKKEKFGHNVVKHHFGREYVTLDD